MADIAKSLKTLQMIQDDMKSDVVEFDGKPLTGRAVGTIHGNLAAAISTLAGMMQKHLEDCKKQ